MRHHWQSSVGYTWVMGHGLASSGYSGGEQQQYGMYDASGSLNLEMVAKYRTRVTAGGWWFAAGGQQRFPRHSGQCHAD